ncbi:hypothetical protein FRC03_011809 [Tulasnella sp. 419]|nr:hypothetical protein FRC03_011809 [Tulasnella sp. 419]
MSPRPYFPPASPFFQPPTSPPTPLPSLDALRAGLIRSNSAAARMMAMHKLTGGKESPEPLRSSPSPTPTSLGRSNTVTGGERIAARKLMMSRLGERVKEADSGGEEVATSPPTPRRPIPAELTTLSQSTHRSPAHSVANGPVDDREERSPTSPNTPSAVMSNALPPMSSSLSSVREEHQKRYESSSYSSSLADREHSQISGDGHFEYDGAEVRDGVVIESYESADDVPIVRPNVRSAGPSQLPPKPFHLTIPGSPVPTPRNGRKRPSSRPSDIPSTSSSTLTASASGGDSIPLFMPEEGQASPYKQDAFPVTISPFGTPIKESIVAESEEEGERVVYREEMKAREALAGTVENERPVSWRDLPENPVQEEYDDEDEPLPNEDAEPNSMHQDTAERDSVISRPTPSPRDTNAVISDVGASPSPETPVSTYEPSPEMQAPAIPDSARASRVSEPHSRGSAASRRTQSAWPTQGKPGGDGQELLTDWEDIQTDREVQASDDKSSKKGESRWEKMKAPFLSRSNSQSGRRSRSNSFVAKREESSRESGVSTMSGINVSNGRTTPVQLPSASASTHSLAPPTIPPPRGGVSPIPPASATDLAKYQDTKLMPFPGLAKLQEEKMQRDRVNAGDSGAPTAPNGPSARVNSPEPSEKDHQSIFRQALDSKPLKKSPSPPAHGAVPSEDARPPSRSNSARTQPSFFDRPMTPSKHALSRSESTSAASPLPQNKEGVRKWLNLNTKKWLSTSTPIDAGVIGAGMNGASILNAGNTSSNGPTPTEKPHKNRRPSLSDLLTARRTSDNAAEKEDAKARAAVEQPLPQLTASPEEQTQPTPLMEIPSDPFAAPAPRDPTPTHQEDPKPSPPASKKEPEVPTPTRSATPARTETPQLQIDPTIVPAPVSPALSISHSAANSSTGPSGGISATSTPAPDGLGPRSAEVLQRLDSILDQASPQVDPRPNVLEDPPRKLLLVSKALQVVDRNTVKDRYLFLFTDILVIAKPVDEEGNRDVNKSPLDRSFVVKSIVELSKVQFDGSKAEGNSMTNTSDFHKHPSVKLFVQRFAKDPDYALASFLEKTKLKDDPATIANLIFRTVELDKTQLGNYLSRRSNKAILKAFIDRFGFAGIRIDNALRSFLLSIRLPTDPHLMEHLLLTFSNRWFEANMGIVSFDKEVAARLVFAMMQLNDALYSALNEDTTPAGGAFSFPNRMISSRDFVDAFRVWDRRVLVPDEVLDKIYHSIQHEKLAQAADASVTPIIASFSPDVLPSKLTTRVPSDPITIKIPQPDPHFGIHLQGQDLLFDPPVLTFANSAEASFRIIGNSLGTKTAILARTGPNAAQYSGIPLSRTFYVERAFMRNTFRIAFTNHLAVKRRYLFSVDNKSDLENWTTTIQRQIARAQSEPNSQPLGQVSAKVRRAAEAVALQVLRDSLIPPEDSPKGVASVNGSSFRGFGGSRPGMFPPSPGFPFTMGGRPALSSTHLPSSALGTATTTGSSFVGPGGGPSTGHDLLVAIQQNSLIPLVLSFLNVVKPV